ncbi:hypothetical protein AB6A40_002873 [Gnathostoma spinigerum]|uniref:Helicase ATP-binding domain-containing protein n=1 Tax=Gnathostoma spinigerum TaxID=75299 RepID=A0ABD6EDD9_9BILA
MSSRSPGYCLDKCVGDHPKRLHTSSIIRKDRKHFRKSIKLEATEYNHVLICGYHVQLPRSIIPYPSQRTMIAKILTSLKNKLNALIESPTGSGKTLGLLSASCTWLLKYKEERERSIKDCKLCHTRNGYELDNGNAGHQTTSNENSLPENQETSFANQLSDNDLVSEDSLRSMDEEFESDFVPVDVHPFLQRLSAQLKADHTESVKMDGNEASPHSHTCLPSVFFYLSSLYLRTVCIRMY